jgi:hypothetical protein
MESHASEAARNGFDAVWWTDHMELFETLDDIRIDFSAAAVDQDGEAVIFGARQGRHLSLLKVDRPDAGVDTRIEGASLVVEVAAEARAADYRSVRLTPASRLGRVHTIEFCRPISSGLTIDAYLDAEGLCEDTGVAFSFEFSWHPEGRHRARFEGVAGEAGAPVATDDTTVVGQFTLPPPAGRETEGRARPVSIDLERALGLLAHGSDNTLSSFRLEISARNGKSISVRIDSLVIRSRRPAGAAQYATVDSLSRAYGEQFGLRSYVGAETGKIHTPQSPHMNGYLPPASRSSDTLFIDWRLPREQWVSRIHDAGGVVSFNHPFGASRNPRGRRDGGEDYENASDDAAGIEPPRVLAATRAPASEEEFWEVATPLLDGRGLGADLLEVGYIYRGIGSLEDHLRLWDLALANGVPLVGIGTSDSHGGVWGPDMVPNPFGTWVWAGTPDAADLIKALKRGHAAFGDPFGFKSDFVFTAGDSKGREAMMGDTLVAARASEVSMRVGFEPAPGEVRVEAVEVKMSPERELRATRRGL